MAAQSPPHGLKVGQGTGGAERFLQQIADLDQAVLVTSGEVEQSAYAVQLVLGGGAVDEPGRA